MGFCNMSLLLKLKKPCQNKIFDNGKSIDLKCTYIIVINKGYHTFSGISRVRALVVSSS